MAEHEYWSRDHQKFVDAKRRSRPEKRQARHVGRSSVLQRRFGALVSHLEEGFGTIEHPRRGRTRVPNSPIRLHGSAPRPIERMAPLLGQDTDRVLAELLGLDADELAALHAAGVIEPVKS